MICPRCKAENPANAQYCQQCGFKLFTTQTIDCKICPNCGKLNALDQSICPNCHYDLRNVQVKQRVQKQRLKLPQHHSRALGAVIILLGILVGLTAIYGTYFHHGWQGQELVPLKVVRYSPDKRTRLKTFYLTLIFENHRYKKTGHDSYFHAITVNSINDSSDLSAKQALAIYRHSPQRRVNVATANIPNQNFSKIQYLYQNKQWFHLKKVRPTLCEGYVSIDGHRYFDRIYIYESE